VDSAGKAVAKAALKQAQVVQKLEVAQGTAKEAEEARRELEAKLAQTGDGAKIAQQVAEQDSLEKAVVTAQAEVEEAKQARSSAEARANTIAAYDSRISGMVRSGSMTASEAEKSFVSIDGLRESAESLGRESQSAGGKSTAAVQTVRDGVVDVGNILGNLEALAQKAEKNKQESNKGLQDAEQARLASQQEAKEAKSAASEKEQLALRSTHEKVLAQQASNKAQEELVKTDLDSANARNVLKADQTALSLKQGVVEHLNQKVNQANVQVDSSATEMHTKLSNAETARQKLETAQENLHNLRLATGEIEEGEVVSLDVDDRVDDRITRVSE